MNAELELRLAGHEDAAVMHDIIQAAFKARPPLDPPADALGETVDDTRRHLEDCTGIIASREGTDIGCLFVCLHPGEGQASLHRVSVLPEVRSSGVATTMVEAAAALAAEQGARRMWLEARKELSAVVRWWQNHGFVIDHEVDHGYIMIRKLPTRVMVPTAEAMRALGVRLSRLLRPGDLVVLSGELGAGKTTMTQGLGAGLDVEGPVISPTFVLSRVHRSRCSGPDLVHVDAFRLGSAAELEDLDLDASLPNSVTVVEWGTGLAEGLVQSRLDVNIARSGDPDDETRTVLLDGVGDRWAGVDLGALADEMAIGEQQ